jgi:hypothetical protein
MGIEEGDVRLAICIASTTRHAKGTFDPTQRPRTYRDFRSGA